MDGPAWLERSPHAPLLHALRSLAWADGGLDLAEAEAIARVAASLDVELHCAALEAWLAERPSRETAPAEPDAFGRLFVLSQALRLAWADGAFTADERERVGRWAAAWGISNAQLEGLEAEVTAERAAAADPFA